MIIKPKEKKIIVPQVLCVEGKVRFVFEDKDGKKKTIINSNMVVDSGLAILMQAIAWSGGNPAEEITGDPYIALGEVTIAGAVPAPDVSDVLLNDELPDINYPRIEVEDADVTRQNNVVIFEAMFNLDEGNPTAGKELCEAGLFWDDATSTRETGNLVARVLIQPRKVKTNLQTLTVTWYIQLGRKPSSRRVLVYP